jgi:DnaK suppressor protein
MKGLHMDDRMKRFLDQLLKKKREFEKALELLLESQREYNDGLSDTNIADETDHAQRETSLHSNYSLIERKSLEIKQINRLVEKIKSGDKFGECEECGEPIPTARLLIMPESTLCIKCQRDLEKSAQLRSMGSRGQDRLSPRMESPWEYVDEWDDTDKGRDLVGSESLCVVELDEGEGHEEQEAV